MQLAGDTYRLRADVFRSEFRRDATVQEIVLEHLHDLMGQMAQSNVCNRFHSVRQRLSRWLLMTQDRGRSDTIPLTQEKQLPNIKVLSVAPLLADAIKRIHFNESVSKLFE